MEQFLDQFHFRDFLTASAPSLEEALAQAAQLIAEAENVVAFTGAGISVESGIPDFRSPHGLWAKFDPVRYCSYHRFLAQPELFWEMAAEMERLMRGAQPNPAHRALAELQALGRLQAVITQNVDHLHQAAGSPAVVELHGSARTMTCIACREQEPCQNGAPQAAGGPEARVPRCRICDGVMKMDVVLFGEELPAAVMEGAKRAAMAADVMLVVGTSLMVAPANGLMELCRLRGGKIIIVNVDPGSLKGADVGLEGKAGEVLPRLVEACKQHAKARRAASCRALG